MAVLRAFVVPGRPRLRLDLAGPDILTWNTMYDIVSRVVRGRARAKLHIPAPLARAMAAAFRLLPGGGPFDRGQVVMAQEDNVADAGIIERVFGFRPASFEETLAGYRDELLSANTRPRPQTPRRPHGNDAA